MATEEKKKQKLSGISAGKTINGQTVKKVYYYDEEKNYIIFQNDLDEVVYFGNMQVSEITPYLGECNFLRDMAHGNRIKKWVDYQKLYFPEMNIDQSSYLQIHQRYYVVYLQ